MSKNIVETAREAGSFTTLLAAVVPGRVSAEAAVLSSAPTVQGTDLPLAADGGVVAGDAHVVVTDLEASNGVIHLIDRVLLPAAA
jgi:uncharacterized surface protein with fasciclin (FAS1) repeats